MAKIILLIWMLLILTRTSSSTEVSCDFKTSSFWAVYSMYNCYVTKNLNIDAQDKAVITKASGQHLPGKSNMDEIVFDTHKKNIHFFPRGLEKFFENLYGIILCDEPINSIQQSDLKEYTKLVFLQITETKIQVLEDGLFDFNPKLKFLSLNENKIVHIGLTVFDNLSNLYSLHLKENACIDKAAIKSAAKVKNLIKEIKTNECKDFEFLRLDRDLKLLDTCPLNSEIEGLREVQLKRIEMKLQATIFSKNTALKQKIQDIRNKYNDCLETTTVPMTTQIIDQQEDEQSTTIESESSCTFDNQKLLKIDEKIDIHEQNLDQIKTDIYGKLEKIELRFDDLKESVGLQLEKLENRLMEKIEKLLKTIYI